MWCNIGEALCIDKWINKQTYFVMLQPYAKIISILFFFPHQFYTQYPIITKQKQDLRMFCQFINPLIPGPWGVFCIHPIVQTAIFNHYGNRIYRFKAIKLTVSVWPILRCNYFSDNSSLFHNMWVVKQVRGDLTLLCTIHNLQEFR